MKLKSFGYNFIQGVMNIGRNRLFSLASVATMTACLFLFGMFYALSINVNSIVNQTEQTMCITVFFDNGIPEISKQDIGRRISERSEVLRIEYTSADEAWESWKKEHFKGYESLIEGFKNDNPLANSSSYQVYLKDITKQDEMVSYIKTITGVRNVNSSRTAAQNLEQVSWIVSSVCLAIIIILIFVALFLISNTISVGVSVRRDEIEIMKFVGATDAFVRTPFIVEGVIIGLLGSLIPLVIVYYIYDSVLEYVVKHSNILIGNIQLVSIGEIFRFLAPITIIIGVGIGYLGSYFTLKKQIRLISRKETK